jgi:DNA-binding HxlR family transcriptional regulator
MANASYGQFCPVAMAAEILCTRWTIVLVRELAAGSTRFNDLRRGVPRMSPALLSQRLKDLEAAGIVSRVPVSRESGAFDYRLTRAGQELAPVVEAFGVWGKRWIDGDLSLERLDVQLLMWDMRRGLVLEPMPDRKIIVQFRYGELPVDRRSWWLVVEPGQETELCSVDPGLDVDLYVSTDLKTMTAIWMGYDTLAAAKSDRRLMLTGDDRLSESMETWLGLSPFAKTRPAEPIDSSAR